MRIPKIHESRTAGVTTFWVETPAPFTAVLAFRVGHSDENVLNRGITHLVEHVALHSLRQAEYEFNGSVTGDMLLFWASGTESEIAAFHSELCQHLRSLPTDRLETEAGVLRAEVAERGVHNADYLLGAFFGPNGPGLLSCWERGFDLVGPKEAQAWVDSHCTRQNAVLLLAGPSRPELTLDLGEGTHRPCRVPGPDVGYRPNRTEVITEQGRGICLAGLTERTTEAALSWDVLTDRLTERLRHDLGLVYNIGTSYLPLDADTAFVFAGVDAASEGRLMETARAYLKVVNELRDRGPTADDLARSVKKHETALTSDALAFARSELMRVGYNRLLGFSETGLDELLQERKDATPDAVQAAFRRIIGGAAVVAPDPAGLGLPVRELRLDRPVKGRVFRPRGRPSGDLRKIIVGEEGISGEAGRRWVTIRWDDVVSVDRPAVTHWSLQSRTGAYMTIATEDYWRKRKLCRVLEDHTPPGVLVPRQRRE